MSVSKKAILDVFAKLESDQESWKSLGFQNDNIINCLERLKKRIIGWFTHNGEWEGNNTNDLAETWTSFEKKQLGAYKRWTKNTGMKDEYSVFDKNQQFDARFKNVFLYYLVYGEIHDMRGIQGVLHALYHCALSRLKSKQKIGDYLKDQGAKFYKLLGLVYCKEEMLQFCFHHDDLDDLFSSNWVRNHFFKENEPDAFKAFEIEEKFPKLHLVLSLPTPDFIKYWIKGAQGRLSDKDRETRNEWIQTNFLDEESKPKCDELKKKIGDLNKEIQKLDSSRKAQQADTEKADHYRPTEEDYEDRPSVFFNFRAALTEFETAKELLLTAESSQKAAKSNHDEGTKKYFRERENAKKCFKEAKKLYKLAEKDFEEASKGFARAADSFKALGEVDLDSFVYESRHLKEESSYQRALQQRALLNLKLTKILHFAFEIVVNKERSKFAKKYKTYFEKSGGWAGWRGYLTIIYHYSQIVYLHLFLIFPLSWLYFNWETQIDTADFAGSIQKMVSTDTLFSPEKNFLIMAGITIATLVLAIILLNVVFRWRLYGVRANGRGKGTPHHYNMKAKIHNIILWIFVLATELMVMDLLVLNGLRDAYLQLTFDNNSWYIPVVLIVLWLPAIILYLTSIQFVFSLWIGLFGWVYGIANGCYNTIYWSQVIAAFDTYEIPLHESTSFTPSPIVEAFCKTMLPKEYAAQLDDNKKNIAFAQVWNVVLNYFYDIHKLSKEELQRYTYKLKSQNPNDFLSGEIEKLPDLSKEPLVKEVKQHLIRFVNNVKVKQKPTKRLSVKEMQPLNIVTPVGAEKILYTYEYITFIDNTQSSFLQHLIESSPQEWQNFKKKECVSMKAQDWAERLEKDIMQGAAQDNKQKKKRWIHNTTEGQNIKRKLAEWASIRFQALFRTVNGFMQLPKALAILARIEEPSKSQGEAEELVRTKFSYLIGYQNFSQYRSTYKNSKKKISNNEDLTSGEREAHEAVYNIKYLKQRYPEVKIAYPDQIDGKWYARMMSGISKQNSAYSDYKIEMFGPFLDMGLGKPTHQNFLSQFMDGLILEAIDVNQDNVISQSFFVPNVLSEFAVDSKVKMIGFPEFIVTTNWSETAWCSAFGEHTFGSLTQRTYSKLGIRLHYGHPDFLDALYIMTETGMSKMPYVSEDIFTGFDMVIKGAKIIHIEYHEVGKARDVDLYTTTKFQRKISMGASQMACTRYINQLQNSGNINLVQNWSFYYSTVGFYVNHQILYLSVWFALVSQFILVILQDSVLGSDVSNFISVRVFFAQVGYALVVPGVVQLFLEIGFLRGIWAYISHFFILSVYSTFHILNVAAFWQFGLTSSAFYLGSGRGTGLEHYYMKDLYSTFYKSHWRAGFFIFWMGVIVFALSLDWYVWILMYLAPSGVWLWGAHFLNPGSLPTTVHEEQWKRLMNRDMEETREVVQGHAKFDVHMKPVRGNVCKKFFVGIGRLFKSLWRTLHYLYTAINFAFHTRIVRVISVLATLWELVMSEKIPTYIFTDDRRRLLRWEDEDTRMKSVFLSTMTPQQQQLMLQNSQTNLNRDLGSINAYTSEDPENKDSNSGRGPLPTPPKKQPSSRRPRALRPGQPSVRFQPDK